MPRRLPALALPCLLLAGCGPTPAPTGQATPTSEAETTPTTAKDGKLTDHELREMLKGETFASLRKKWGEPVWYLNDVQSFAAGWHDVATPKDGKPVVTLVVFTSDGNAFKDETGKVAGGHLPKPDPITEDKRVDREDLKKAVLGWNKGDVRRVLGNPVKSTNLGNTSDSWVFKARTFDKATGDKPDDDFTVSIRDGYCDAIYFTTK
jgi:hypothetical protein